MASASVLVIDESPTILKLVQVLLVGAGHRVTTAVTATAGLAAARADKPDLVVVDFLLPDHSGLHVCSTMARDARLRDVPVVVMSARADEIEDLPAHAPNVTDTILKPFAPEALLAVVNQSLQSLATHGPEDPAAPVDLATVGDPRERPSENPAPTTIDESTAASLAGDLAVISLGDVLLLLQDQRQTGVLTLAHGDDRTEIILHHGRIDFAAAAPGAEEFLLGRFAVEAGIIDRAALQEVLAERKKQTSPGLLGQDLIAAGLMSPTQLRQAIGLQTSALVYEGMRRTVGRFWFRATTDLPPSATEASLGVAVDGLLMEGMRRIDEWRVIKSEITHFDLVFVRMDDKIDAFGQVHLTREERAVLAFVNGKATVKDIVAESQMGSFDVCKILFRLLKTKLVRRRTGPVAV